MSRPSIRGLDAGPRERLLAGLAIEERRVDVAGVPTAVLEAGDGPPLVLLHGGIECGGVYWAPIVSRLAQHHRVVIPDVPGLGESAPVARLDADAFDGWLAALLRLTCEGEPLLVAHSLLGSLAARFAVANGDRLRRLVVYGAPGIGHYRVPLSLLVALIRSGLRPSRRSQERFLPWPFLDPDRTRRRDPEWFEAFVTYMVSRARVQHVKRTMRQLVKAGTTQIADDELRQIEIPTALLWGRHDRMTPLRIAEEASTRLGWPLHVVDDAGHVPHIEQPEAFLASLHTALPGALGRSPR
jgi:pimeloyl-ACP methyl ester carboxylesterase